METAELFQRFSLALAIGLLIGIERGWQTREEREGERAAGLRTQTLAAVLGAVWGTIARLTAGIGVAARLVAHMGGSVGTYALAAISGLAALLLGPLPF